LASVSVPALKLSLYFNETLRSDGDLACDRLLDLFERANVKASVLLRGIEGFGAHHRLHTERLENASLNQPLIAIAIDREERIAALLPRVDEVLESGLVTTERAWLLDDPATTALPEVAHDSVKLTIYCGRAERSGGRAAFRAIVDHLCASGIDGSNVFLGVDGTVHGRRERARFFSRNRDVPLMIVAIGDRAAVAAALPGIGRLADASIVTVEGIQICKRDGELLSLPAPLSGAADGGAWCKLMIHAAGDAHVAGDSLHYSLVDQLRRIDASGATSLRGIWGHRGATAPHGDTIRSLRRTAPVATIVIDREQRLAEAWRIIDRLTGSTGLVTSELVPAHRALARERAIG
jgi:PII-like signaling protein